MNHSTKTLPTQHLPPLRDCSENVERGEKLFVKVFKGYRVTHKG